MNRRSGFSAAIVGPDGAGKSTLLESLERSLPFPVTVAKVSVHSTGRRIRPAALRWVARSLRGARFMVEIRVRLWLGQTVLWDRHPLEDGVTARMGRRVMGRGRGWMSLLAPAPDLLVVLDAPVPVLRSRRREQDPEQLANLRTAYLALAKRHPHVIVNAARPPAEVRDRVATAIRHSRNRLCAGTNDGGEPGRGPDDAPGGADR
jgi:thymidylate kinase